MSSARSTLLYEISLYLDLPISEMKAKYGDVSDYLFSLCRKVYQKFRKKLCKKYRKNGVAKYYKSGFILNKYFSHYRYV